MATTFAKHSGQLVEISGGGSLSLGGLNRICVTAVYNNSKLLSKFLLSK